MSRMLGLFLTVALFAISTLGCSGTKYTVRAGFQHDSLSVDRELDIAGWGAGGTIGVIATSDGVQAIELCGDGRFAFGEMVPEREVLADGGVLTTTVQQVNLVPIGVCIEMPVN